MRENREEEETTATRTQAHDRLGRIVIVVAVLLVCSLAYSSSISKEELKGILGMDTYLRTKRSMASAPTAKLENEEDVTNLTAYELYDIEDLQPGWHSAWEYLIQHWTWQNDTFGTFAIDAFYDPRTSNKQSKPKQTHEKNPHQLDTSVIITSNLIPTWPSIDMSNATIYSLHQHLVGLPKETPIFISIDKPPPKKLAEGDNQQRLDEHIRRLKTANFSSVFTNVQVVLMEQHHFLAGNIYHTLVHHVETPFVYIIQHDMPFVRGVFHSRVIQAMKDHPTVLNNIRFRLNNTANTQTTCHYNKTIYDSTNGTARNLSLPEGAFVSDNGLEFYVSKFVSDNNHLTTKWFYLETMKRFLSLRFAPELFMMTGGREFCSIFGQQLYGNRDDHFPFIDHLDGRLTEV